MRNLTGIVFGAGVGLGLLLVSAASRADDGSALAEKSGCMACHKVDVKLIGPAYKDVAAKYKGDPKAAETLTKKVKTGGSGVWGEVPMPPNVTVSDDDIKKLVTWVLSLK